jgi:hypothetical protein
MHKTRLFKRTKPTAANDTSEICFTFFKKGSNWIMMKMLLVLWPLANKKVNGQTWPFGRASHFGRSIRISTATVVQESASAQEIYRRRK